MLHHKNVGDNLFMKVKLMRSFLLCMIEATWKTYVRWEGNIKMDLKQIKWKNINWIYLAQAKDKWWAVVNMVRNLQVPHNKGYFLTSRELLPSQERLYSMALVS